MGIKKKEYAQLTGYYCQLKAEIDEPGQPHACYYGMHPDCRGCPQRKGLEAKWDAIFK